MSDLPSDTTAMATRQIEIRLSDDYRRAKRNHLFTSGAVLLLALAVSAEVNVPGFPDTKLPAATALLLAWFAALFFADEFRTEYLVARVRNSEINANLTGLEIDRAFAARIGAVDEITQNLTDIALRIETLWPKFKLDKLSDQLNRLHELNPKLDKTALFLGSFSIGSGTVSGGIAAGKADELGGTMRELVTPMQQIQRDLENLRPLLTPSEFLADKTTLDDIRQADVALQTSFGKTHKSIHFQQRYAFRRDAVISILLFVAATMGMLVHLGPAAWSAIHPAPKATPNPKPVSPMRGEPWAKPSTAPVSKPSSQSRPSPLRLPG